MFSEYDTQIVDELIKINFRLYIEFIAEHFFQSLTWENPSNLSYFL